METFFIDSITFEDPTNATISLNGNLDMARYEELGGLGNITIPTLFTLGFRINEENNQLVSCITYLNKRQVDTLREEEFLPDLDIFYDRDSTFSYQLMTRDSSNVIVQSCNPFDVQEALSVFAQGEQLKNNDRILVYRRNLIFQN